MTLALSTKSNEVERADPDQLSGQTQAFVAMAHRHRMIAVTLLLSYLGVVVLVGAPVADAENLYVMAALFLYILLLTVPFLMYRAGFGWLHPLIINSIMSFMFLVRSFPAHAWGLPKHNALPYVSPQHLTELLAYKLVLMSIGQAALLLGFAATPRLWAPRIQTSPWPGLLTRTSAIVIASSMAAIAFILNRGGLSAFLVSLGKSRHDALGGQQYFLYPATLGAAACILCVAARPQAVKNPWFWLVAAVGLCLEPMLTFSRSTLAFGTFALLFTYALTVGRMPIGRGALAVLLTVYMVTAVGDLRQSTYRNRLERGASADEEFSETIARGWSGEFVGRATTADGALPILARVPSEIDFLYGESYLAIFAMPIPRSLWPEKPTMVGGRVGRTFFHTKAGIPPGPIGEAYWNLHIPGIVLIFFMSGIFMRFVARLRQRNPDDPLACALAVILIVYFSPASDSLLASMMHISQLLVCALLLYRPRFREAISLSTLGKMRVFR